MKKVQCECGQSFTPSTRGNEQRFCSVKCRMRAYRRRFSEKRNVTPDSQAQETIELLRKENARLRRLLTEAQAQSPPKPKGTKAKSKQKPCPICGKVVKLIVDPSGFVVPRHRMQFGRQICKGSDLLLAADGRL